MHDPSLSGTLSFIWVNSTVNVKVKTGLPDYLTEEHVAQSNKTQQFFAMVDTNEFKVGPETNRAILIIIYNFTTPLTIKVMFPKVIFTRGIFTKLLVMNFLGDRHTRVS